MCKDVFLSLMDGKLSSGGCVVVSTNCEESSSDGGCRQKGERYPKCNPQLLARLIGRNEAYAVPSLF